MSAPKSRCLLRDIVVCFGDTEDILEGRDIVLILFLTLFLTLFFRGTLAGEVVYPVREVCLNGLPGLHLFSMLPLFFDGDPLSTSLSRCWTRHIVPSGHDS